MKQYMRIMLGAKSVFAKKCYDEGFIGADHSIKEDLSNKLPEDWREFNANFRPVWLNSHPDKSKIAAGLACGMLWTICKGIKKNDIILSPDGVGNYYVGEVDSDYYYEPNEILSSKKSEMVPFYH